MRFASLGSGSKGNATLIEGDDTLVLVDCGFSAKEASRRLERLGIDPHQITAVLVTHEHGDHINGVARLSRRYDLPVYLTGGTLMATKDRDFFATRTISPHTAFTLGSLSIQPFPVPHDARDPCQFVFSHRGARLGLLTDVGSLTPHLIDCLNGVHGLLLECNYDPQMLRDGPYPASLQQRIHGRYGHLANSQAETLLKRLDTTELRLLRGMHISEKNNLASLAMNALCEGMGHSENWIDVACQEDGFAWQEL